VVWYDIQSLPKGPHPSPNPKPRPHRAATKQGRHLIIEYGILCGCGFGWGDECVLLGSETCF